MSSVSNRRVALTEFVKRLRNDLAANLVDVRLFGSEARGQATPESNIDVLVIVQPEGQRAALEDRAIDIAFESTSSSVSTSRLASSRQGF